MSDSVMEPVTDITARQSWESAFDHAHRIAYRYAFNRLSYVWGINNGHRIAREYAELVAGFAATGTKLPPQPLMFAQYWAMANQGRGAQRAGSATSD